jgi:hypothetical protein
MTKTASTVPVTPEGQPTVADGKEAKKFAISIMSQAPSEAIQVRALASHGVTGTTRQERIPRTVIGATSGSASIFAGTE